MGRPLRQAPGGIAYHLLNRGNGRLTIFRKDADYQAFERILAQALERVPGMRLLAYCLMPNHWHLVVWPRRDGELSDFGHWLTLTHTQRWHAHYHNVGGGHLYQGRFKSFPVQEDEHLLTLLRYAERNALRAGLVKRAEDWQWSSLWRRQTGDAEQQRWLSAWPVPCPRNWLSLVNAAHTDKELERLRQSVQRGQPYGDVVWTERTAKRLNLESSLRPRGRPRKSPEKGS